MGWTHECLNHVLTARLRQESVSCSFAPSSGHSPRMECKIYLPATSLFPFYPEIILTKIQESREAKLGEKKRNRRKKMNTSYGGSFPNNFTLKEEDTRRGFHDEEITAIPQILPCEKRGPSTVLHVGRADSIPPPHGCGDIPTGEMTFLVLVVNYTLTVTKNNTQDTTSRTQLWTARRWVAN